MSVATNTAWWSRSDLNYQHGELVIGGRKASDFARALGTPLFVYNAKRVVDNADRIKDALEDAGFFNRCKVLYAMKANRFAPLMTVLKFSGLVGIDACSPNEVEHAISCGFRTNEISLTATNLSTVDLLRLSKFRGLRINLDSVSAIRRWGELMKGSTIGIRINPAIGVGRSGNDKLQYCRDDTTKFGIYEEQFDEALSVCREFDLNVETIHFHTGCGYLNEQLESLAKVVETGMRFVDRVGSVKTVNVGGGLGVPHVAEDSQLNLTHWAQVLAEHLGPRELHVEVEPGDYLVKDAGILLLTVNTVETRRNKRFVGVDAGFNIAPEPAVYSLPFEPVVLRPRHGETETVSVAGNINEALDLFYVDIEMPTIHEGDQMALLNAGAYSSSMASNHCMRGEFKEVLIT